MGDLVKPVPVLWSQVTKNESVSHEKMKYHINRHGCIHVHVYGGKKVKATGEEKCVTP